MEYPLVILEDFLFEISLSIFKMTLVLVVFKES